jgi:hypothetical protein
MRLRRVGLCRLMYSSFDGRWPRRTERSGGTRDVRPRPSASLLPIALDDAAPSREAACGQGG